MVRIILPLFRLKLAQLNIFILAYEFLRLKGLYLRIVSLSVVQD